MTVPTTSAAGNGAPEQPLPWARQRSTPVTRATARSRNVVTDLPNWEPLPPGEILVHRQRLE